MLPYIKYIQSQDWGLIVLNTNHNKDPETGDNILDSETPEKHAVTVWREIVTKCEAEKISVIAHSYGGVVSMALAGDDEVRPEFQERVVGVFLTDSVHYGLSGNRDLDNKLKQIGKNYIASDHVS